MRTEFIKSTGDHRPLFTSPLFEKSKEQAIQTYKVRLQAQKKLQGKWSTTGTFGVPVSNFSTVHHMLLPTLVPKLGKVYRALLFPS